MDSKKAIRQLNALRQNGSDMRLAAESWKNDYEILISTILSARTRDEVTIPVAEKLFKRFPAPAKLAKADIKEIQKSIRPINFYKNKSKSILNCAKEIIKHHDGKIPHDFEKLLTLPGVGRKTANVFLNEIGHDAIGVDTHLGYISNYLGWTQNKNPHKIENDLKILFPKKHWSQLNSVTVRFGKTYTSRRKKDALLKEIKEIK